MGKITRAYEHFPKPDDGQVKGFGSGARSYCPRCGSLEPWKNACQCTPDDIEEIDELSLEELEDHLIYE